MIVRRTSDFETHHVSPIETRRRAGLFSRKHQSLDNLADDNLRLDRRQTLADRLFVDENAKHCPAVVGRLCLNNDPHFDAALMLRGLQPSDARAVELGSAVQLGATLIPRSGAVRQPTLGFVVNPPLRILGGGKVLYAGDGSICPGYDHTILLAGHRRRK
jgi:hypothetical protein